MDRRELGSAACAIDDERFADLLNQTLRAWGIGIRASHMVPRDAFGARLRALAESIAALDGPCIEDDDLDVEKRVSRSMDSSPNSAS